MHHYICITYIQGKNCSSDWYVQTVSTEENQHNRNIAGVFWDNFQFFGKERGLYITPCITAIGKNILPNVAQFPHATSMYRPYHGNIMKKVLMIIRVYMTTPTFRSTGYRCLFSHHSGIASARRNYISTSWSKLTWVSKLDRGKRWISGSTMNLDLNLLCHGGRHIFGQWGV